MDTVRYHIHMQSLFKHCTIRRIKVIFSIEDQIQYKGNEELKIQINRTETAKNILIITI